MPRYKFYYRWQITYYPGMTPFHESGGAGQDTLEIDAPDSQQAESIARQELDRSFADEISRLSGDDRSYSFIIQKIEFISP
jgi:hypothetical protein